MLEINDLFSNDFIERTFASSIVSRLVEKPMEMPRFATSSGCPTAMASAARLKQVSPSVAVRAIAIRGRFSF
jgi:hypothetical protein